MSERSDGIEFKIEKVERVAEIPEIENCVMSAIRNETVNKLTNCHDELMLTMLEQYGIDRHDLSEENLRRVEIVHMCGARMEHVFVDGYYAFTIESIPQVITEWEKEGIFRAEAGYRVRVYEDMKGRRTR